jgi:hypothetical protein
LAKKNPGRRKLTGIFFWSVLVLQFFWADFSLKTTRFSGKEKKLLKLLQSAEFVTPIFLWIQTFKIVLCAKIW